MPQGSVASGGKVDIIHPALRSHVDPRFVSLMILTNLRLRDSNRQFLAGPSLRYIRAYMSTSSSRTTVLSTERPHRWNPKFDLDLSPTIIILRYPRLFCASYESNHGSDSYEKKKNHPLAIKDNSSCHTTKPPNDDECPKVLPQWSAPNSFVAQAIMFTERSVNNQLSSTSDVQLSQLIFLHSHRCPGAYVWFVPHALASPMVTCWTIPT